MLDWRPFALSYVLNSYEDFTKRFEQSERLAKARANADSPLFTYQPTPHDVEQEANKFQVLQLKVMRQRRLIRRADKHLAHKKATEEQLHAQEQLAAKAKRRVLNEHFRGLSAVSDSRLSATMPRRQELLADGGSFFGLTEAVSDNGKGAKTTRAKVSSLPPIKGMKRRGKVHSEDMKGN